MAIVSEMLSHSNSAITKDLYGHMFDAPARLQRKEFPPSCRNEILVRAALCSQPCSQCNKKDPFGSLKRSERV